MTLGLAKAERGCLLLADITGYTTYLQGTELEHAQDVLADLLETIVDALEPIFKLSKLEGDAAFAYFRWGSMSPSSIIDTVELTYFSFRKRLRDVEHATTCECNACVLIPNLDLKFFVHEGEYVVRRIARNEELTGKDVVLVHRLLKGTSSSVVGDRAFAAYTAAAVEKMEIEPSTLNFTRHIETIPDLGEVEVLIQDLQAAWELENERSRVFVTADEAKMIETFEFPLPPAVVWDLLTNPAKRFRWQSSLTSLDMVTDGRLGQGSINHCVHGPNRIVEHVADWRPFSYFTLAYELEDDDELWPWTFELEPTEDGTRVSWRLSDLGEGRMDFFDDWLARWQEDAKGDIPLLNELVEEEVGRLGPRG